MKSKRTSLLLLIAMGILCIGISLFIGYSNQEAEGKDKKEPKLVTEDSEGVTTKAADEQKTSKTTTEEKKETATTEVELNHETPVNEINTDMYEWPYDNGWFEGYKEPDMVIYLAQRKELFDELVSQFQKYEGKAFSGAVYWDEEEQVVCYRSFFSEDVVSIYYEFEKFFREGIISHFQIDGITFPFIQFKNQVVFYIITMMRTEMKKRMNF